MRGILVYETLKVVTKTGNSSCSREIFCIFLFSFRTGRHQCPLSLTTVAAPMFHVQRLLPVRCMPGRTLPAGRSKKKSRPDHAVFCLPETTDTR